MGLRRLGLSTILLLLTIGGLWSPYYRRPHSIPRPLQAALPVPEGRPHSFSTTFPANEATLTEKGNWMDGQSVGLDWCRAATLNGLAYGTESGTGKGDQSYDDSTALLTGSWGPDQTVEARVRSVNQTDRLFEEVELRLRSSLSPHRSTGYEVLFRCSRTPQAYASIARWDGPVGKFAYLDQQSGAQVGVGDGDIVKAVIAGNLITGYINGVQVLRATDATFSGGSPGIGFWMKRHTGLRAWLTTLEIRNTDYGFTSVAAWDE